MLKITSNREMSCLSSALGAVTQDFLLQLCAVRQFLTLELRRDVLNFTFYMSQYTAFSIYKKNVQNNNLF